jgi:hypothetical protein
LPEEQLHHAFSPQYEPEEQLHHAFSPQYELDYLSLSYPVRLSYFSAMEQCFSLTTF